MRKISILLLAIVISNFNSFAQKIEPITINVSELTAKETEHLPSHDREFRKDNEEKEDKFNVAKTLRDLPIPLGAKIFRQKEGAVATTPNPLETSSPSPNITFDGSVDQGQIIPPDGGGAVGPGHVVTALNDLFRFKSKTGTLLHTLSMNTFFDPTGNRNFSDPHVKFDHFSNRWIATAITVDEDANNFEVVSVSATADPTGIWHTYYFESDPDDRFRFNDYPLMGFNEKWITVSGNMFNNVTGDFEAVILFVLDKRAMYAGQNIEIGVNGARILARENGGLPGLAGNACPVIPLQAEAANAPMYIIQNWSGSLSTIRLSSIIGTLPNITWDINNSIYYQGGSSWNHYWSDGPSSNCAPQLGDTRLVAQNDARINNAFQVNGSIWASHSVFLTSPIQHAAIQWWQVNPRSGVVQRGRIDDPTGMRHRSFSSIVVNKNEDVLVGYSTFQNSIYPSASYVFRSRNTPNNQMDNEVVFKTGLGSYYKDFGRGINRYGDYASGALDPVDGSLWTMNHYAAARVGSADNDSRWGTWWAQVIPPSVGAVINDVQLFGITEPSPGPYYCQNSFSPKIVIRNGSSNTLTTTKVNYRIDGGVAVTFNWTGSLAQYESAVVSFPPVAGLSTGNHVFEAYTTLPNGASDGRLYNDTSSTSFTVVPIVSLPLVEKFTSSVFPPTNWTRINPDNSLTWKRSASAGFTAIGSATVNCYNYGASNSKQRDQLRTPLLDIPSTADSIILNFAHAHAMYTGGAYREGMEVMVSGDCGHTWTTVWSKFDSDLATVQPTTAEFIPTSANQWKKNVIDISQFKTAGKVVVKFESVNDFGNNIFLDDINIFSKQAAQRDLTIPSIIAPVHYECNNPFAPVIIIRQLGKSAITNAKVNYQIDGGTINTVNWVGSLGYGDSTNFELPPVNLVAGVHTFKVWVSEPNGLPDEVPANDTTTKNEFIVFGKQFDPLKESFEGTTFQPAGWGIQNADNSITWSRTIKAAKTGAASAFVNNYNYATTNQPDLLITPVVVPLPNNDSMFLHFQLSAATRSYPGSTELPLDSLEVLLTTDCGKTYTSVYKKWGIDLQTLNNPNEPTDHEFIPLSSNQWRKEIVDLTPYLTTGANGFQIVFRNVSNFENNIFIDDINMFTKQVPAQLKAQGYMITPNPFENHFVIQHYLHPTDLRTIGVYNSIGQLIQRMDFNGDALSYIDVDMHKFPAGLYTVQLIYTNHQVAQHILKAK